VSVLFGDAPLQPDSDQIEKAAADYRAHGLSPEYALGQAQADSRRDQLADRELREERTAQADRVEGKQTAFLMALRRGEAHTFAEGMKARYEAGLVADEIERRQEAHRRRDLYPDRMIGQLSGTSLPVPAPETPASKRARVARRAKEIVAAMGDSRHGSMSGLGSKPAERDTVEQYRQYGRSEPDDGVRYRDGGGIVSIR
jgi:hypothetical protein